MQFQLLKVMSVRHNIMEVQTPATWRKAGDLVHRWWNEAIETSKKGRNSYWFCFQWRVPNLTVAADFCSGSAAATRRGPLALAAGGRARTAVPPPGHRAAVATSTTIPLTPGVRRPPARRELEWSRRGRGRERERERDRQRTEDSSSDPAEQQPAQAPSTFLPWFFHPFHCRKSLLILPYESLIFLPQF